MAGHMGSHGATPMDLSVRAPPASRNAANVGDPNASGHPTPWGNMGPDRARWGRVGSDGARWGHVHGHVVLRGFTARVLSGAH
eukprot:1396502-Prymnesium_polylepis.1